MIHFNFVVSDSEAEVIIDCMDNAVNDNRRRILSLMKEKTNKENDITTLKEYNEYLLQLIDKMNFSRVMGG